jgi:hypothetical protein
MARHSAGGRSPAPELPLSPSRYRWGAGKSPRFGLFAKSSAAASGLIERFSTVLESDLCPPFREDGLWLVRPDGHVTCAAAASMKASSPVICPSNSNVCCGSSSSVWVRTRNVRSSSDRYRIAAPRQPTKRATMRHFACALHAVRSRHSFLTPLLVQRPRNAMMLPST